MQNKKINSRNTENAYELISEIKLISRNSKNVYIGISGTEFKNISKTGNDTHLVMSNFKVNKKYCTKHEEDYPIIRLFKNIEKFASKCNNHLEVITLLIDAFKENRKELAIKIKTCPVYSDALDYKYVFNSLIDN